MPTRWYALNKYSYAGIMTDVSRLYSIMEPYHESQLTDSTSKNHPSSRRINWWVLPADIIHPEYNDH